MRVPAICLTVMMATMLLQACGDDRDVPDVSSLPTAADGHGGGGQHGFKTLADLGSAYKTAVFAPAGISVSGPSAIEDDKGELAHYDYWIFGGAGSVGVTRQVPGPLADQPEAKRINTDYDRIRSVPLLDGGREYLFIQEQHKLYPSHDTFQLLWLEDGAFLRLIVSTFGPAPGPDALLQTARLMRRFEPSEFSSSELVTFTHGSIFDFFQVGDAGAAESALGFRPVTLADVSHFTVLKEAGVRGYSADLDEKGLRRMYRIPSMPDKTEAGLPNVVSFEDVTVGGTGAVFESVKTESGATSLLYFKVGAEVFMIRDATGAAPADLIAAAESSAPEPINPGPSLSIDLDSATPGIQNTRTVAPGAAAEIAIVAENISAAYAGYQWELEWDDATLDFGSAVENTAEHGISTCAAAVTTTDGGAGVPLGKEWAGQGAGCVSLSGTTTFSGTLVTITVRCAVGGTTDARLVTYAEDGTFGTALIGDTGAPIATVYGDAASLTCGGP